MPTQQKGVRLKAYGKCRECIKPASGRDSLCRSCRGKLHAQNFIKRQTPVYPWDEKKDLSLKRCYASPKRKDVSRALTRLAADLGYPKGALRRRAEQLGLTIWSTVRWTAEEIEFLEEHLGSKSIGWICKKLKKKTGRGRSYNSIKCKAADIGRGVRYTNGYTMNELAELFGTTYHTIRSWFDRTWLSADANERTSDRAVLKFMREHPDEWHFKRIDEAWLKGLLFPMFGSRSSSFPDTRSNPIPVYHSLNADGASL